MSRQRRRSGIIDGTTHACPACNGAGVVRSSETAALRILRAVEREALTGRAGMITVRCSIDVTLYVLNHKREWLRRIETDYGVSAVILADPGKIGDAFELERLGAPREIAPQAQVVRADQTDAIEIEAPAAEAEDSDLGDEAEEIERNREADGGAREGDGGRRRRRRRRRARGDDSQRPRSLDERREDRPVEEDRGENVDDDRGEGRPAQAQGGDGEGQRKRRRRGRRGGRRNRGRNDERAPGGALTPEVDADDGVTQPDYFASPAGEPERPAMQQLTAAKASVGPEPDLAPIAGATGAKASRTAPSLHDPVEPEPRDADGGEVRQAKKGWWRRAIGE
jgi:ribonuclease E